MVNKGEFERYQEKVTFSIIKIKITFKICFYLFIPQKKQLLYIISITTKMFKLCFYLRCYVIILFVY